MNRTLPLFRPVVSAIVVCLLCCTATTAVAQLAPPSSEVELLRQQLQQLQSQMKTMETADQKPEPEALRRVKSVGVQRPKPVAQPVIDDSIEIRLYDLSDIFAVSPHYKAVYPLEVGQAGLVFPVTPGQQTGGGGFGGGSGGVFNISPAAPWQHAQEMNLSQAQISMDKLVTAIKATVSSERWGNDSDDAKIQVLGNTVLIAATDNMHQQIASLLNLFRQHWGKLRTISVQAWWIRSTSAETAALLSDELQQEAGVGVVAADKWKDYLKSAETEKRLAYSTRLTGHNNQTLSGVSGQQHQLVIDAVPLKSRTKSKDKDDEVTKTSSAIVGMRPQIESVHRGVILQATPLATRGGNYVVLDLHSKVNELTSTDQKPADQKSDAAADPSELAEAPSATGPTPSRSVFAYSANGTKMEVMLDPAAYASHQLSTTLRCPKAEVVLAGGMRFKGGENSDTPNLYLFVKTLVHTIDEDQSDWTDR